MPSPAMKRQLLLGTIAYSQRVLNIAPANLIGYWPLWEAGGTIAYDQSAQQNHAAYSGATLAQPGIGDGKYSTYFDGAAGYVDLYSAALAADFNSDEFTIFGWCKFPAAAWTDGLLHVLLMLRATSSNFIQVSKTTTNNMLKFDCTFGTVSYARSLIAQTSTDWFNWGISRSRSADTLKIFIDGHQRNITVTGANAMSGALASGRTLLAANNVVPSQLFYLGNQAHVALWNAALSDSKMQNLAWNKVNKVAVFLGDSITSGQGASDAAHRWVNLVCAARGWSMFQNSGVSGTVLQNTFQNTVATTGAAVNGNLTDNYIDRCTANHPDYVFILYGTNDMSLNDGAFSDSEFQIDLGDIVDAIVAAGTPAGNIIIGSTPYVRTHPCQGAPWNASSAIKHTAYVAACAAVAATKSTKYVDIYQIMADGGGNALMSDNVHPNDAGHAVIADAFLAAM